MISLFFPSAIWKLKARAALKNNWQTGLLIALIVNLPSLLVQAVGSFTGYDLMLRIQNALNEAVSAGSLSDTDGLLKLLQEQLHIPGVQLLSAFNILSWLLTPCLAMGLLHWCLLRLRSREAGIATVFSRLSLFLKGIGLRLLITFKVFLWMLPGAAVSALAVVPVLMNGSSGFSASSSLLSVSSILMAVLGVMAALRYALADIVMADVPETGVFEAVRRSKELMRGRKGILFAMYFSFIGWYFLEMLISSFALSMFGSVPALMIQMLCSLALSLYLQTTLCAYFMDCSQATDEIASRINEDDGSGFVQ